MSAMLRGGIIALEERESMESNHTEGAALHKLGNLEHLDICQTSQWTTSTFFFVLFFKRRSKSLEDNDTLINLPSDPLSFCTSFKSLFSYPRSSCDHIILNLSQKWKYFDWFVQHYVSFYCFHSNIGFFASFPYFCSSQFQGGETSEKKGQEVLANGSHSLALEPHQNEEKGPDFLQFMIFISKQIVNGCHP